MTGRAGFRQRHMTPMGMIEILRGDIRRGRRDGPGIHAQRGAGRRSDRRVRRTRMQRRGIAGHGNQRHRQQR
ncbi:hypothetical protein BURKHO8Y_180155 [Burkholderia sp. 8Y]|nr:hypothetical protein BURKHO8Y_180155 [Burkholderia sp. 8Y]